MKKVVFLGFGDSNRGFDISGYEIWTCNDWWRLYPTLEPDIIFQIHKISKKRLYKLNQIGRFIGWEEKYRQYNHKIYTLQHFPKDRAVKEFGTDFFRSTFSYMFYEAIKNGYNEIVLVGADLMHHTEYETQIHGMLRNIEVAKEHGITVIAPYKKIWEVFAERYKEKYPKEFVYGF